MNSREVTKEAVRKVSAQFQFLLVDDCIHNQLGVTLITIPFSQVVLHHVDTRDMYLDGVGHHRLNFWLWLPSCLLRRQKRDAREKQKGDCEFFHRGPLIVCTNYSGIERRLGSGFVTQFGNTFPQKLATRSFRSAKLLRGTALRALFRNPRDGTAPDGAIRQNDFVFVVERGRPRIFGRFQESCVVVTGNEMNLEKL